MCRAIVQIAMMRWFRSSVMITSKTVTQGLETDDVIDQMVPALVQVRTDLFCIGLLRPHDHPPDCTDMISGRCVSSAISG